MWGIKHSRSEHLWVSASVIYTRHKVNILENRRMLLASFDDISIELQSKSLFIEGLWLALFKMALINRSFFLNVLDGRYQNQLQSLLTKKWVLFFTEAVVIYLYKGVYVYTIRACKLLMMQFK